ncbi:restriction endonuclease subunit S [Desulfofustis limnaeus]|nr:restriction endonuclease subunit S [Desulfofustis limnaeus]
MGVMPACALKIAVSFKAAPFCPLMFNKISPFPDGHYLAKALHADKDGVCSTELLVLKPQPDIHPRFLLYSMLSPDFVGQVDASTFGAKMPRANWEFIGSMKLPTPTYETQRLIADYLDRETARIDALVAEKEKMLALLEEKRAALISRAVTRGLDPNAPLKPSNAPWFDKTPLSWSVERLKWVIQSVSSGVSVNASDQPIEGDGFGVLKTSAVAGGAFVPGENKLVWDTEYDRLACPVTKNTIIMSRMNTPNLVGESGYVPEDYPNLFLPDRLWQISFDENRVFVPFVALLLSCKEARHALSSKATGTSPSMKNLAIEEMSSLLVPVPPLEEQVSIYREVARHEAITNPLRSEITNSLELLHERRAALITAAVTGQISVEEMSA